MGDKVPADDDAVEPEAVPALPEHLAALVGALHGPEDLARNHDKYLSYPDREDAAGAASA